MGLGVVPQLNRLLQDRVQLLAQLGRVGLCRQLRFQALQIRTGPGQRLSGLVPGPRPLGQRGRLGLQARQVVQERFGLGDLGLQPGHLVGNGCQALPVGPEGVSLQRALLLQLLHQSQPILLRERTAAQRAVGLGLLQTGDAFAQRGHLTPESLVLGGERRALLGYLDHVGPCCIQALLQLSQVGDPGAHSLQLLQHLRRGQAALQIGDLARRHLALGLQSVASLGQLALHLVASLVQLAQSGQLLAQRPLLLLGLTEGGEPRLDLVGLGQQRLMPGKLGLPLLPLPLQRLQLEPGLRLPCIQLVELRPVVPELGPERLHSLPGFLGLLQRAAERLRVLPRRLDLGLVLGASQQLGRDLIQSQVERALLLLDLAQPLLCPLLVHRPGLQAQDVAQHALPFRGGLHRELVRPALAQEGRVDEGVVVQPQHPLDLGLGIPDGALR